MSDDDDFMQASDDEGYIKLQPISGDLLMLADMISNMKRTMKRKVEMSISKTNTTTPNR